jgi:non-ribosomal peptide synthetase component F
VSDLVGYFVNTLPLRYDLSGNPTLGEILGRVRVTVLAGFEHQEVPFEEVVRAAGAERSESATPLFQMMVTYREDGDPVGQFAPGIDFGTAHRIALSTVKSDAELYITVSGDTITVVGGYADELYEHATVQRFADTLIRAFDHDWLHGVAVIGSRTTLRTPTPSTGRLPRRPQQLRNRQQSCSGTW